MLNAIADALSYALEGALDAMLHAMDGSLGVLESVLSVLARAGAALWRA